MPKQRRGRAVIEEAVRQEVGECAADEPAELGSAEEALAAAQRLLELDALVKPLMREIDALVPSLRDYMLGAGESVLLTDIGSVELRTATVARVDYALIPPAILAAARVPKTQHSLFRKPNVGGIRQGVLRGMHATGARAKRARRG